MNSAVSNSHLQPHDHEHLKKISISPAEVTRQLELLRKNARVVVLARPCTVSDGIFKISESEVQLLSKKALAAVEEGRVSNFIPASGAATRMFADLVTARSGECSLANLQDCESEAKSGNKSAKALLEFLHHIALFPFFEGLRAAVATNSNQKLDLKRFSVGRDFKKQNIELILNTLLDTPGLNFSNSPKALIAFHRYENGTTRTPFEEHLINAAHTIKDKNGVCRLHFTISPEHEGGFKKLQQQVVSAVESSFKCHFEISYSFQDASTNAIALDLSNDQPLRDANGKLILRQAGHGSLLKNLTEVSGDIVYLNNIDNVQPEGRKEPWQKSKYVLIGKLLETQSHVADAIKKMDAECSDGDLAKIASELLPSLGITPAKSVSTDRNYIRSLLERPIRVCGMVKNQGEPGGGPQWVTTVDGTCSCQIVEKDEVDKSKSGQEEIFKQGTHFNPVRVVCGLRDYRGKAFSLADFANHEAVFTAQKVVNGRQSRILERPGLWNGSMARWITVFVEVDPRSFSPVKTVFDLLRPEHLVTPSSTVYT